MPVPMLAESTVSAIVQLLVSLGGAGLLVQLLLLRQNRRKIAGEASTNEANAASTLSGAAMKMVENAQAKELEAEQRADRIQVEYEARREADGRELEVRAWRIHHLEMRQAILENALRQGGVEVPPEPEYEIPSHLKAPPPQGGPSPATPQS
jgi:hypothetical protein